MIKEEGLENVWVWYIILVKVVWVVIDSWGVIGLMELNMVMLEGCGYFVILIYLGEGNGDCL